MDHIPIVYRNRKTAVVQIVPSDTPTHSRHLSATEIVTDILHHHGASTVLHVARFHSDTRLRHEDVEDAWQRLVLHQPALRVGIKTARGRTGISGMFVDIPPGGSEISFVDQSLDNSDWIPMVEEELSLPFTESIQVLWKAVLLRLGGGVEAQSPDAPASMAFNPNTPTNYVIIFKAHHVIADHVSVFRLLVKQFLRLVDKGLPYDTRLSFPPVLMPSVDQSFSAVSKKKLKMPGKFKSRRARSATRYEHASSSSSRDMNSSSHSSSDTILSSTTISGRPTSHSSVRVMSLPVNEAARLRRACDVQGVSPLDVVAVAASVAYSITSHLQSVPLNSNDVHCCCWLSLRGLHSSQSQVNALGMWECPIIAKVMPPVTFPQPHTFWGMARVLSHTLNPAREPWKRAFSDYKKALDVVNAEETVTDFPEIDLKIPRSHFECVVLADPMTTRGDLDLSGSDHRTLSASSSVCSDTMAASSRPNRDTFGSLAVDEYYCMASPGPGSSSSLKLSACFLASRGLFCSVTWNGRRIRDRFARKFLDLTVNVLKAMVSEACLLRSEGVEKLPPYIRAKVL